MDTRELFSDSVYAEQEHKEDEELSAFTSAVKESYGPEQARLSEHDWLEESDLIDGPPLSVGRNWRGVSIAASARLPNRLNRAK